MTEPRAENEINPLDIGFYCKSCGIYIRNFDEPERCPHCHIPICQKCTSCNLCLHCYIHLKERTRRLLKFFQTMIWASPFLLLFTFYNGWQTYLINTGIAVTFFTTAYYIEIQIILKKPFVHFDSTWENTIRSDEYQQISNEKSARRYISPEAVEELLKREAELADHLNKLTERSFQRTTQNSVQNSIVPISYKLIGKPCPKCGKIIEFADFCVECELKFCPICDQEHDPYSKRCVCGFEFPNLIDEFNLKFQAGENKK